MAAATRWSGPQRRMAAAVRQSGAGGHVCGAERSAEQRGMGQMRRRLAGECHDERPRAACGEEPHAGEGSCAVFFRSKLTSGGG